MTRPKKRKFSPRRRQRYLELLAKGMRRGAAAEAVGVGRSTTYRAMRDEPEFATAVEDAEMLADEEVEASLRRKALEGNVPALIFWLTNRGPDRWVNTQRREVHHKITDGERALIVRAATAAGLSRDQLEAMARILEGRVDDNDDTTLH